MISFVQSTHSMVCLRHDWNRIRDNESFERDHVWYSEATIQVHSNDEMAIFSKIEGRMSQKHYPWWKVWFDKGTGLINVTIGVSGIDMHQAIANIIGGVAEARSVTRSEESLNMTIGRAYVNRENDHFILYNACDPNVLLVHSWRNPMDEKCFDFYLNEYQVVYNRFQIAK